MQLKSILCPIDCSEFSAAAYQYALSLAEYYKARPVCLHVIELWKYPFADYAAYEVDFAKFSQAIDEGGEKRLQEFVNKHTGNQVRPDLVVQQGNASDRILSFAEAENIEVIVMGTHGRGGFDRLVLGSTTDKVIRKAACPVLVVSSSSHNLMTTTPDGRHRVGRILYCTDFSNNSELARGYAISLAAEYGAELTLLHVSEENASSLAKTEAILAERTEELDKLISKDERKNLNVKAIVKSGKPYQEIVQHAHEAQITLIIMTARGGDSLDRAVFGSTTYRVIQLGPCPVLAVHT
jgi:nucleotide-binding universal stress UspA family protein